ARRRQAPSATAASAAPGWAQKPSRAQVATSSARAGPAAATAASPSATCAVRAVFMPSSAPLAEPTPPDLGVGVDPEPLQVEVAQPDLPLGVELEVGPPQLVAA